MTGRPAPRGLRSRVIDADFTALGTNLAVAGVVLVLASFTVLDWFRNQISFPGTSTTRFADVHQFQQQALAQVDAQGISGYFTLGVSGPYFSWLGWVILLVSTVAAALACSRAGRDHWSLRWLGAVLAAIGVGMTFTAIDLIVVQGDPPRSLGLPHYGDYLANSSIGAWAAILGFLLLLTGCLVPRGD